MARIIRVKVNWTGFVGSPGYTNFHFEPTAGGDIDQTVVDDAATKVGTFLQAWRAYQPSGVQTAVDAAVAEIDENHGNIEAFWSVTTPNSGTGTNPGAYAAGSGACVSWYTSDARDGRRVRGRTFMVPIGPGGLDSNGTLDNTALTAFRNAAATLMNDATAARLVVWCRPTDQPLLIGGGAYNITAYAINDKVAQLRSRRD
jgi:hypothetical protein